jgi:hypothetical protein
MSLQSKIITFSLVADSYKRMGYKLFSGAYDLNIFGIRSSNSVSNKFDDLIGVAYTDEKKVLNIKLYPATTDPGLHWLHNPSNKKGCAILVPGQYSGVLTIGLHGRSGASPYKALEQIGAMCYVRDNNKDGMLDFSLYRDPDKKKENAFWDIIKSNLHRASAWKIVQLIDQYSAACQVIQAPKHFEELMFLCEKQIDYGHGSKFTYTLFEETEIFP